MSQSIKIEAGELKLQDCESVIIVPEIAITEPGYIKPLTIKDSAHAKHEYHAMAQMAYFQYQDDELEFVETDSVITVFSENEKVEVNDGMVLCRGKNGEFRVLFLAMMNKKKLLEAAYRYCTRWVRLDI